MWNALGQNDWAWLLNTNRPPDHLRVWRAGVKFMGAVVIDGDYRHHIEAVTEKEAKETIEKVAANLGLLSGGPA